MPERSPENQEVVRLLAKLKQSTPDYPADLLEARKHSFLKQIVDVQLSAEGRSGEGGAAGPARPGAALRGGATVLGIPLKTALAIGAAILLLTAGYLFRDQIVEFLAENGVVPTEETAPPPFAPTPVRPAGETPTFGAPAPGGMATPATPGSGDNGPEGTPTPPPQSGPVSVFEYLICVLRNGAESCR